MSLFNKDFFYNIALLLKPNLLVPTYEIENINDLDRLLPILKNIRAIIFDVDQTLLVYDQDSINDSIEIVLNKLSSIYRCCFLSNYPNHQYAKARLINLEHQTGIPVVRSKRKKPNPGAFQEALRVLGTNINDTIVVGDRILTDILGANNLGMISVLIKPINWKVDPVLMVTIPRMIELVILKIVKSLKI